MIRLSIIVVVTLVSSLAIAQAAPCELGPTWGSNYREFSLPRNSVCLINRQNITKLVSIKIIVKPKLGRFASASLAEWAYRAGNVAGNDYFEYITTETLGGIPKDYRVRNVVHVTP
jgi:hypothetical protein